jgi:flagellin-like hook-associated protein FlgL
VFFDFLGNVGSAQNTPTFQVGANQGKTVRVSLRNTTSLKLVTGIKNRSGFGSLTVVRSSAESQNTIAGSRVRDAKKAAEMAVFTRNQIRAQSGNAIRAQAKQSPKGVLRLLW